jgi:hypothetical protein
VTRKLKLLFDECLGKPVVEKLGELLTRLVEEPVELRHLLDLQPPGTKDQIWVPKIAGGDWIVISTDRGKKNKGAKLPLVCQRFGVTHVLFSAAVHRRTSREKIEAILEVWPDLAKVADAPRGSRYLLMLTPAGKAKLVLKSPGER